MAPLLDVDYLDESRTHLWGAVAFPKLSSLWKKGIGCDVTLVCYDGSIKAPSVLLCALSEKLQKLIVLSEDKILTFLNVSVKCWSQLLDVMYLGKFHDDSLYGTQDFVDILLTADALEMSDMLSLIHHLLILNKNKDEMVNLTKVLPALQDMKVECSYNSGGKSCNTVLSNEEVEKLAWIFNTEYVETLPPTGHSYSDLCISCKGSCSAEKIQCMYCFKVILRTEGKCHMKECHKCCNSRVLPYTCAISESNHQHIKGHRILMKSNSKSDIWSLYTCDLCDYSTKTFEKIIDHFMIHGFFPNYCSSCGDMFDHVAIEKIHKQYCGKLQDLENTDSLEKFKPANDNQQSEEIQQKNYELDNYIYMDNFEAVELSSIDRDASDEISDEENIIQDEVDGRSHSGTTELLLSKCIVCFDKCSSNVVMCLLCHEIVPNKISHMLTEHSKCKKAKVWAYTCNVQHNEEGGQKSKIIVTKDIVDDVEYYRCRKCFKYYETKQMMFLHLRASHRIMCTFYCSHCESGFTNAVCRNSHQHLCGGGDYIKCKKCKVFFGSLELLNQHAVVCINQGKYKRRKEKFMKCEKKNVMETSKCEKSRGYSRNKYSMEKLKLKISTKTDTDYINSSEFSQQNNDQEEIWSPICFSCTQPCSAKKVKCIYCLKVVDNNISHMNEFHPFTPKSSMFVYTCKYLRKTVNSDYEWVVCVKEQKGTSDREANSNEVRYRCMKCTKSFQKLSNVKIHLKKNHKIAAKVCRICHTGFSKHCHLKDHQHFCAGGELLKCEMCDKVVGCYKAYYDHIWRVHPGKFVHEKDNLTPDTLKKDSKGDASVEMDMDGISTVKFEGLIQPKNEESNNVNQDIYSATLYDNSEDEELKGKEGESNNHADEAFDHKTDTVYCENLQDMFQMVNRNISNDILKVCLQCDENCTAESVRCIYCMKVVVTKDKDSHINDFHQYMPTSKIWPVKCKWAQKELNSHIIAVPTERDRETYNCQLCGSDTLTCQKSVSEHELQVHQMKVYFCTFCRVGMRTQRSRLEHQHFCGGNDVIKCLKCNEIVGTWQGAYQHKSNCMVATVGAKKIKRILPKKESQYGKYGYKILCADCKGPCDNTKVKCGLCHEVVQLDDVHMKICHPFSPCTSWVVYCRLNYQKGKEEFENNIDVLGQRIPANENDIYQEENCIPIKCPFNYRCNKCDFVTAQKDMLISHIMYVHDEKKVLLSCEQCDSLMTNKTIFQDHSYFCQFGQLYKCDKCDQMLGSYNRLLSHGFISHPKRTPDDNFPPAKGNEIRIPKGTILQCAECDFTTTTYGTLKDHNRKQHGYKKHQVHMICRICYKVFRLQSELEKHHQQIHLNGQRCLCETCGKDFEYPMQLKRHVRYYHKGERENSSIMHKYHRPRKICPQCGITYKTTSALTRHIRITHEKNLYHCKICNKGFCSTSGLKNHMYHHTGEKKYSCPHCVFRAYRSRDVNNHVMKIHPGNPKPYVQTFVLENEQQVNEGTKSNDEFLEANVTSTQMIQDGVDQAYQVFFVANT